MKLSQALVRPPSPTSPPLIRTQNSIFTSNGIRRVFVFGCQSLRIPSCVCSNSGFAVSSSAANPSSPPHVASKSGYDSVLTQQQSEKLEALEEGIEKAIYRCRFMAILGVFGSLMGSFLCFIKAFAEASSNSTGVTSFLENKNGESKNVDLKKKDFQLQKINCKYECSRRCSKASKRKRCKRACKSCCHRCHCVPPGTYGNKDLCPCYATLKTHGNKPKCP